MFEPTNRSDLLRNDEIRRFQMIMWSLEVLDDLTDNPKIKDEVVRDFAETD